MKNIFPSISVLLLGTCLFSACEGDETPPVASTHPTVPFSKIQVVEVQRLDAEPVTLTQTFNFNDGRINSYTTHQKVKANDEIVEIENLTKTTYTIPDEEVQEVTMTDDFGQTLTYTLNEKGYATACNRQGGGSPRSYTFQYRTDGSGLHYLTNITEFWSDGTAYATIDITYSIDNTWYIRQQVDEYEQKYTVTAPTGSEAINNISCLPLPFLTEMHPLSIHTAALYGKLLGEPFPILATRIVPDNNEESQEEITYSYRLTNSGVIDRCTMQTVSYQKSFKRSFIYNIE